ncbi:helix-turn-helix domain-containing protein [Mesorhizobium sp. ANAO-SY3R2]|uniref:helix-turn-helix domain-containing protein n=1 Tax=Mesorhizobium sp. ANAO-SY3R2 TaxID=3166644 RepID=UPI00367091A9
MDLESAGDRDYAGAVAVKGDGFGQSAALATSIPSLRFDTRDLPVEHQFEAWRAFHASVLDATLSPEARQGFVFEQKVWNLGSLAFTSARMPGRPVPRQWRHIRKDPLDHWCLVLPESAMHAAQAAGAPPRQVHIRSLGRPYEGAAADSSVSTVFIPRDLLRPIAGVLDAHPGTLEPTGMGGLLADFLISFERRLSTVSADEMPSYVEAMRAMLSACLAPTSDRVAEAQGQIAATMLERVRQLVHQELYCPELGPDMICRRLGLSRSRLYVLFEPLHGVARYIQRQRLLAAHKELSDPAMARSIGQIAERLCFSDSATFSRAFRNEFGCSPSDVRATAAGGTMPTPARLMLPMMNQTAHLGEILQHLQI